MFLHIHNSVSLVAVVALNPSQAEYILKQEETSSQDLTKPSVRSFEMGKSIRQSFSHYYWLAGITLLRLKGSSLREPDVQITEEHHGEVALEPDWGFVLCWNSVLYNKGIFHRY